MGPNGYCINRIYGPGNGNILCETKKETLGIGPGSCIYGYIIIGANISDEYLIRGDIALLPLLDFCPTKTAIILLRT